MPFCANCNTQFPNHLEIDGKLRNLSSRKYCVVCSPFGAHRTRPIGFVAAAQAGDKRCAVCTKTKDVSEFYARRDGTGVSAYCRLCTMKEARDRVSAFKDKCVQYKGGKCERCEYSKCHAALQFHHNDPEQKDFDLSHARRWSFDERTKLELNKCTLLCANCHAEEHVRLRNIELQPPL